MASWRVPGTQYTTQNSLSPGITQKAGSGLESKPIPGRLLRTTRYQYDIAGRLTWVTDSDTGQTRYDYDTHDRLRQSFGDTIHNSKQSLAMN